MFKPSGLLIFLAFVALALAGCSDDDSNPVDTGDNGNDPGDDPMTEAVAIQQAPYTAAMVAASIEDLDDLTDGATAKNLPWNLTWNEELQMWTAVVVGSENGFDANYVVRVQYRDADGQPIQQAENASTMRFERGGSYSLTFADNDVSFSIEYEIDQDLMVTDIQTDTRRLDGDATINVAYDYESGEESHSMDTAFGWEIFGIFDLPVDSCPSGTITVYLGEGYVLNVTFHDSSAYAGYSLFGPDEDRIEAGSDDFPIDCTP